jgi:hypothetical protein
MIQGHIKQQLIPLGLDKGSNKYSITIIIGNMRKIYVQMRHVESKMNKISDLHTLVAFSHV